MPAMRLAIASRRLDLHQDRAVVGLGRTRLDHLDIAQRLARGIQHRHDCRRAVMLSRRNS